ncbi:MAG: hypothetical protein ACPGYX_03820 [Oceanobacter sp.]
MANFLSNLFSSGAGNLVDAVGDAIDKNFTSDEERKELEVEEAKAAMQYKMQIKTLALDETKALLADTNSARDNQTRIQQSEHSSWLAKNVHSIMGMTIVAATFFMYIWIINLEPSKLTNSGMKDIVIYILGALTTISTQVAAYYFGSSVGSKDKQKALDNIAASVGKK